VGTIRESDDEIRIVATTEANDLNLLTAEWVSGMSNGDY